MNLSQQTVANFCNEFNISASASYRMLDLVSEVGELSKEILKSTNYGKNELIATNKDLELEVGDVLFSLICLANQLDINLENSLNQVLDKYKTRIAQKNTAGSS